MSKKRKQKKMKLKPIAKRLGVDRHSLALELMDIQARYRQGQAGKPVTRMRLGFLT